MASPSHRHRGASCFCFEATERRGHLREYRLDFMHEQSRRLIRSWFDKAIENQNAPPEDSFEPFIYAWFAFNGWVACVTSEDTDSRYMQELIADEKLQQKFAGLLSGDSVFADSARRFADCWPIFTVKSLRGRQINLMDAGDRASVVQHYLDQGASSFQPQCWTEHRDRDESCPCDWPHTIAAIYRVPCNLFHGEKAASSPIDQNIVHAAFRVLARFIQKAELL
jgi:hypothetical protein